MKKISLALVWIALLPIIGMAQKNQAANAILNKSALALKNNVGLSASYSTTTMDRNKHRSASGSGAIYLKKNKYFIQDGNSQIISDGSKVWNYNGENEVMVSAASTSHNAMSPEAILSGNLPTAEFNYGAPVSTGTNYFLSLTPVDKRKNFTLIELYINKSSYLITKATVKDKSGNTTTFTLSNIKNNKAIPDSKFAFDVRQHPKVEVVEN